MMRARYAKAADIFARALDLAEHERSAFVRNACEGDADLLGTVEGLLSSDATDSFLDDPYQLPDPIDHEMGLRAERAVSVGNYRITRLIARGGMAAVFLAEQVNTNREIALKLLSLDGAASRTLAGEAAALGRLQHPGVARVYEAGTADVVLDDGESFRASYIAMEFIDGVTLSDFAARTDIDRRSVTEMLLAIAEAIEHAHQRGVVHRDLKPSNILIDRDSKPHVIDFGVGLVRESDSVHNAASLAGTISYMAPEQLLGQLDRIDTRADIFAIGAIGYELIAQQPLHGPVTHIDDAVMSRLVRTSPVADRGFEAKAGRQLARVLRRATEPDQEERYRSASEFAEDLRRVLDGRPLDTDEVSVVDAVWLYAKRHRFIAIAFVVGFAALVAGVMVVAQASGKTRAALLATESAREEAALQAMYSDRIAEFLKSSFLGVDPEELGASVTLFDAIDYAAGRIHRDLADIPEVEADVRAAIGFVYRRHGRYADALEQLRIAHRLHEAALGPAHPSTLDSLEELGYLTWLYEGDADTAIRELRSVVSARASAAGNEQAGQGWIHIKIASIAMAVDRPGLARHHLGIAQPLLVSEYGDVYAARPMRLMALVAASMNDASEAERLAREALALCEHAAEQDYIAERARMSLGSVLIDVGELDEARVHLTTALRGFDRLFGEGSVESADAHAALAWLELHANRRAEAIRHAQDAQSVRTQILAPTHPELLAAEALVTACTAVGTDDYFAGLNTAFESMERAYGPDHRDAIRLLSIAVHAAVEAGDSHTSRRFVESKRILSERRKMRLGAAVPAE